MDAKEKAFGRARKELVNLITSENLTNEVKLDEIDEKFEAYKNQLIRNTKAKPKTDLVVNLGDLNGPDGNAFWILGKVSSALKQNGFTHLVDEYRQKAMSGDYDNLLKVTEQYVYTA